MKAFKKALLLLLAMIVVFTLAACGSSEESTETTDTSAAPEATAGAGDSGEAEAKPEEGAKLLVWESREERPFVEEVLKQFKEKYQVDFEYAEMGAADTVTKQTTDGPAGIGADVFVFPHDNLGRAIAANLVLPNDTYEKQTKEEHMAPAVSATSYKGVLYGFPKAVETYALFYNTDIIKDVPKTYDDVKAFAKTFNNKADNKYAFMWDIGNFYFSYPFFSSLGGYVFGAGGTDPADIGLNNAGAVEGLKVMQSLKVEALPLKSGDVNWDIKTDLFSKGKLAMNVDGPWAISSFKGKVPFAVAKLPELAAGKPSKSFSGVKAWYVSAFTKYPVASKLFARFSTTKEMAIKNNEVTGALPSRIDTKEDPAIANNPLVLGFLEQFDNSEPMPSIPEMGNVWGPAGASLSTIWNDGKDAQAELDNAVKQIKEAIAAAGTQ
jgi:arabinogalactan oligomer/maltooligosaccharide transport system substrate-binding protein